MDPAWCLGLSRGCVDRASSTWCTIGDQVGWKAQARKTSLNCGAASLDWRWFEISFAEPTPDRTQGKSVSCRSIRSGLATSQARQPGKDTQGAIPQVQPRGDVAGDGNEVSERRGPFS